MTNLPEDPGCIDDENYIYLDKDGNAQKMIEVTVHWNPVPKQVILVTVSKKYLIFSDSLSYLCFRIGEAMEKYSTFSGLTNLRAVNLMDNQILLPKVIFSQVGTIGDYIKTGDHLTCDITSNDIWIDVQVECSLIQLIISFEIKVSFTIAIETLQYSLVEIVNKVLNTRSVPFQYEESDIQLKKVLLEQQSDGSQDYKKNAIGPSINRKLAVDMFKSNHVGDELDYLNRYVMCSLDKRKKSEFDLSQPANSSHSYTINDTFNDLTCTFPIRSLKVEPKVYSNPYEMKTHNKIQNESMNRQKMCHCDCF